MGITFYSIPNCPNCKHLEMLLNRAGVSYGHRTFDPENDDDVAEMAYLGLLNAQFPVVYIDGERLPAMTLSEYMERIKG